MGELTIDNSEQGAKIEIYDLKGLRVAQFVATGSQTIINIAHLPQGTYLVRVGNKTVKIVKF
jgi:hypothetical protein